MRSDECEDGEWYLIHHSSFRIHRLLESPRAHVREVARDGGGGGHRGADEVRAPTLALPALEVAVARRGAALARTQDVRVHPQTHRAAGLAPPEARGAEDGVKPLGLRRAFDGLRAGPDHRLNLAAGPVTSQHPRGGAQVFQARVGAGADEDALDGNVLDARARREAHVVERAREGT